MQYNDELQVVLGGRKFRKLMERNFWDLRKRYGLREIEIEIMLYLSNRPGDSASCICRNLYMNKGHVSQALNSLCVNGFLNILPAAGDRRFINYEITDKGRALLKETTRLRNSFYEKLLDGISPEELKVLEHTTSVISRNLDHYEI